MKCLAQSLLAASLLALAPTMAQADEAAAAAAPPVAEASVPQPIILVLPAVAAPDACGPSSADAAATAPETEETDDADLAPPEPFAPRPFSIGLSGLAGTRDDGGGIAATWTAGLDVGLRLTPREDRWLFVDVSLRRITVGGAESLAGERWSIGASPSVRVGGRLHERIELYAEAGLGLQTRFGSQATVIGAAPFGGGGVRFYLADFFSIAIEGALHVPATRGFLLGNEVFPQAAAVFQGGLALTFHLG